MKNAILFLFAIALFATTSCTVEEVDPDLTKDIIGSYTMDTYVTQAGESNPNSNDKIVVNRVDDTHVSVQIDYASATASDVTLGNMSIVRSGSDYTLDQNFDNASADGTVSGNDLTLNVDYDSGSYVNITASK